MTIPILRDDQPHLKIFFDSLDVDHFFAQPSHRRQAGEFVYFARYGKTFDGHRLALNIIRSKNFVVGEKTHILKNFPQTADQNEILESDYFTNVDNINDALNQKMRKIYDEEKLHFKSIAVTGTSGKTSVVQLTGQILSHPLQDSARPASQKILKMGTLGIEIGGTKFPNSHLTTPDYPSFISTLLKAKQENIDTLVMEVSSHGLSEARLNDYQFDIAVFTNFSQDHLDFHKSMDEYFAAKTLLFSKHLKGDGISVISVQSPEWLSLMVSCAGAERTLYLLLNNPSDDDTVFTHAAQFKNNFKDIYFLSVEDKKSTFEGLSGLMHLTDIQKKSLYRGAFRAPLIGNINFENLMSAFCICRSLDYSMPDILKSFTILKGIPGRMEKVGWIPRSSRGMTCESFGLTPHIIVDYAHKPGALESVTQNLRHLLPAGKKLITVFGCGGDRDSTKRPLMGQAASTFSDIVFVTSDNPRTEDPNKIISQIIPGIAASSTYFVEADRAKAIQMAFKIAQESDIILIAGRGHETHQIVGNQKIEFSDVHVAEEFLKTWIPTSHSHG